MKSGLLSPKAKLIIGIISSVLSVESKALELTVYANPTAVENGWGVITERRDITLQNGQNQIFYNRIPASINPETVSMRSLIDESNTTLLQQTYRFDLSDPKTFLNRLVGEEITIEEGGGANITTTTGVLLRANDTFLVQDKNQQMILLKDYTTLRATPKNNNTWFKEPTLIWQILAKKPGLHTIETQYQTKNINWSATYNGVLQEGGDPNQGILALESTVNVTNNTGMDLNDVALKLMAGDINTVSSNRGYAPRSFLMMSAQESANNAPSFSEKAFFEYHLYRLKDKVQLPNNGTQQLRFLPKVSKIIAEKRYVYDSSVGFVYTGYPNTDKTVNTPYNKNIDVFLKWQNTEKMGLGTPLPKGIVRISMTSLQNPIPEFIGEAVIPHTPKDAFVDVKMGQAFDITADKKQTDFNIDMNRHVLTESFEITLKNHKDKNVKLTVKDTFYRAAHWELVSYSNAFTKKDANEIEFPVQLKKEGETVIRYTVRYTW